MKIVHYFPVIDLREGGVARSIVDMAVTLQNNNIECVVCTVQLFDDVKAELEQGGVEVVLIPCKASRLGRYSGESLQTLRALVESCDVVHMHTPWEITNVVVAKLCRFLDKPYVISTHGMLTPWALRQKRVKKTLYFYAFTKKLIARAAATLQTSTMEQEGSQKWIRQARSHILRLPIDWDFVQASGHSIEHHQPSVDRVRQPIKILFLSRVVSNKGIVQCIEALPSIKDIYPLARLEIAGPCDPSYEKKIRERIHAAGVDDSVDLVGMVGGDQKLRCFDLADVFVCASEHENFGLVVIESLARGTPVVISRGVALSRDLELFDFVQILEDTSPQSIADAVLRSLESREPQGAISQRAIQWVRAEFAPESIASAYQSFYQSLA
jgi:glycosyltransferase involved in cell wall biosynthesis